MEVVILSNPSNRDADVAEVVERELPGFWRYLKEQRPEFAPYGDPDGPPLGHLNEGAAVHVAMIELLPAYIAELKARA